MKQKLRLNLVISENSRKRLDRLAELTEADSSAEVIRRALQLYEVMIDHSINNNDFLIRNRKTGETTMYQPFIEVPSQGDNEYAVRNGDPGHGAAVAHAGAG